MKDYFFILIIVALAVFFIIKEIRNDNLDTNLRNANRALNVKYDSLTTKISELEKLILQLDSVKTINNNYYTKVYNESDSLIKVDSNNAYGLFRKQLNILSNSK